MSNQRRQQKPRPSNAPSLLLNPEDNEILFSLLGRSCTTLATGVVQLYMAVPPQRNRWNKRNCGVICFVKDNELRSYYLRLFDIRKKVVLWEQEIYNQFKYKTPRDYFHTFEGNDAQAGLNFADEDEASKFKIAIEKKVNERLEKRMERKRQMQQQQQTPANNQPLTVVQTNIKNKPKAVDTDTVKDTGTLKAKKGKDKDTKRKKLTKDDISQPTDFRHVNHVGWDPNKGLDMNNLDPNMRDLFQQVGVDEAADKETVDFIYDFVDKHGGIDAVKKEFSNRPPPPPRPTGGAPLAPPPQPPPTQRPDIHAHAPRAPAPAPTPLPKAGPPLPSRMAQAPHPQNKAPTPGISKAPAVAPPPPPTAPPQPPGGRMAPAAPQPPSLPPAAPAIPAAPAPPAAPAVPAAPAAPAAQPPPMMPSDGRGALLDDIRKGSALKHLQEQDVHHHGGGDARGDLLDQIRGGATLKRVEPMEAKQVSEEGNVGIVGALARALASRQKHIQGSDEESNDSDDDDVSDEDEWDD